MLNPLHDDPKQPLLAHVIAQFRLRAIRRHNLAMNKRL